MQVSEFGVVLKLWDAKNDTWREGQHVCLSWGPPVSALRDYVNNCEGQEKFDDALFMWGSEECPEGKKGTRVSYARVREQLLRLCRELGWQDRRLGWHSLRAGGLSRAAELGIQEWELRRLGRWKSQGGMEPYIDNTKKRKFGVCRQMLA